MKGDIVTAAKERAATRDFTEVGCYAKLFLKNGTYYAVDHETYNALDRLLEDGIVEWLVFADYFGCRVRQRASEVCDMVLSSPVEAAREDVWIKARKEASKGVPGVDDEED